MQSWGTRCSPTMTVHMLLSCVRRQACCRELLNITPTCMISNEPWCTHICSTLRYGLWILGHACEYPSFRSFCFSLFTLPSHFFLILLILLLVAGELLWRFISRGFTGVFKGNVVGQHPAELAAVCPGSI